MSETPPPYGSTPPPPPGYAPPPVPYGYAPPPHGYPPAYSYAGPPPKKRPSAWWFLPGSIALLIAVACVVYAVVVGVTLYTTDGYVTADGKPQTVELEEPGDRMLFADAGDPDPACVVTENGRTIEVRPVDEITPEPLDLDTGTWLPRLSFTSEGTTVQVTCTGDGESVRVGAPAGDSEYAKLGVAIIAAFGIGLVGMIGLILITVLYFSRRPTRT